MQTCKRKASFLHSISTVVSFYNDKFCKIKLFDYQPQVEQRNFEKLTFRALIIPSSEQLDVTICRAFSDHLNDTVNKQKAFQLIYCLD